MSISFWHIEINSHIEELSKFFKSTVTVSVSNLVVIFLPNLSNSKNFCQKLFFVLLVELSLLFSHNRQPRRDEGMKKKNVGVLHDQKMFEELFASAVRRFAYEPVVGSSNVEKSLGSIERILTSTINIPWVYFETCRVTVVNEFTIDRILYAEKCKAHSLVSTNDTNNDLCHALESAERYESPSVVAIREKETQYEARFGALDLSVRDIKVFRMFMITSNSKKISKNLNVTQRCVQLSINKIKETHGTDSLDSLQVLSRNIFGNVKTPSIMSLK